MARRIVCFGPGPLFKGGISNYNSSLANALHKLPDTEVTIVSWTQQYPAIIPREFKDLKSKQRVLDKTGIDVRYLTNYNNPFSWRKTYREIVALKPEKVIFQWSIALQGLPLGRIAHWLKKHKDIEVIFDLHFVIQKENSKIDQIFTRMGISEADTYVVHAMKTFDELKTLFPDRNFVLTEDGKRRMREYGTTGIQDYRNVAEIPVIKLFHPIYDLFKPDPEFDVEGFKKEHGLKKHVFLFFGFIRKYKGLHHAIESFAKLAKERDDVSLVICGESFWNTLDKSKFSTRLKTALFSIAKSLFLKKSDDEGEYRPLDLLDQFNIRDRCLVVNEFIPNEDVHKYFQVSDCVLLFYLYATPSGIESLSYNFDMPLIANRVGHFPETIKDGYNGYLADPNSVDDMAAKMKAFLEHPIPREHVRETTKEMSWERYAKAILNDR